MPNPTMPPVITNTITIRRTVFNASTKQSTFGDLYSGVPAFINDHPGALQAMGMAPEYQAMIVLPADTDLRDGDQITGYNPLGLAIPPIVQVGHVSTNGAPGMPAFDGVRVGYLKILDRAG